jgi:hypothetical protein
MSEYMGQNTSLPPKARLYSEAVVSDLLYSLSVVVVCTGLNALFFGHRSDGPMLLWLVGIGLATTCLLHAGSVLPHNLLCHLLTFWRYCLKEKCKGEVLCGRRRNVGDWIVLTLRMVIPAALAIFAGTIVFGIPIMILNPIPSFQRVCSVTLADPKGREEPKSFSYPNDSIFGAELRSLFVPLEDKQMTNLEARRKIKEKSVVVELGITHTTPPELWAIERNSSEVTFWDWHRFDHYSQRWLVVSGYPDRFDGGTAHFVERALYRAIPAAEESGWRALMYGVRAACEVFVQLLPFILVVSVLRALVYVGKQYRWLAYALEYSDIPPRLPLSLRALALPLSLVAAAVSIGALPLFEK